MAGLTDEATFDTAAALLLKRPRLEIVSQAASFFDFALSEGEPELALKDWNDLFFVPSSGRYTPPLESVFREGRMGGHHAADAVASYQAAGFEPRELDMDPLWSSALHPDHLGVELAFVSALLRSSTRRPQAATGLTASAEIFHRAHVASWAAEYGRKLSQTAQSSLYRSLGSLLDDLAGWMP